VIRRVEVSEKNGRSAFRQSLPSRRSSALAPWKWFVVLSDQALIGGSSFLTLMLVQRAAGDEQLGIFSLALTLVFFIIATQESLITTPFTVFSCRLDEEKKRKYSGSALLQYGTFAMLFSSVCLSTSFVLSFSGNGSDYSSVALILSWVVPVWLLRDLARRISFADLDIASAAIVSLTTGIVQIGMVVTLFSQGLLTANWGLISIGIACLTAGCIWLVRNRHRFSIDIKRYFPDCKVNWEQGRWMAASQLTSVLAIYSIPWILAFFLGTVSAGIFAACESILRLANPIIVSISNILTPQASIAFSRGGHNEVATIVRRTTLVLLGFMAVFLTLVVLFGGYALMILFNNSYWDHRWILTVMAFSQFATLLSMPAARGILVFERSDINLKIQITGLLITLVMAVVLIPWLGVLGGAYSYLSGSFVMSVLSILAFRLLLKTHARNLSYEQGHSKSVSLESDKPAANETVELIAELAESS
jgi:O-antigen/teichoic acid export membrane protein